MFLQLTSGLTIVSLGLLVMARPTLLVRWLLAPLLPAGMFRGPAGSRQLALTIDDGPSGEGSDRLLAVLKRHRVPATFFLIGSHLQDLDGFAGRALDQGHAVGHHMLVDSRSACLDPRAFAQQFMLTEHLIRQQLPQNASLKWFRPGGGWFHRRMIEHAAERGYRLVLGSVFPWDTVHPPTWFLRAFLLWNAHPGGIIVMHDRPDTINATIATLDAVLPILKQRDYNFVSLDTLIKG